MGILTSSKKPTRQTYDSATNKKERKKERKSPIY